MAAKHFALNSLQFGSFLSSADVRIYLQPPSAGVCFLQPPSPCVDVFNGCPLYYQNVTYLTEQFLTVPMHHTIGKYPMGFVSSPAPLFGESIRRTLFHLTPFCKYCSTRELFMSSYFWLCLIFH